MVLSGYTDNDTISDAIDDEPDDEDELVIDEGAFGNDNSPSPPVPNATDNNKDNDRNAINNDIDWKDEGGDGGGENNSDSNNVDLASVIEAAETSDTIGSQALKELRKDFEKGTDYIDSITYIS